MTEVRNVRHNVITISSISAFVNVKGGIHNSCKDVYFIRAVGVCRDLAQEVRRLEEMLVEKQAGSFAAYKRLENLPKMIAPETVSAGVEAYRLWLESGEKSMPSAAALRQEGIAEHLGNACKKTADLFVRSGQVNESQKRNFVVKLICWFDWLSEGWLAQWDGKEAVKIVAENVVKKQEYFFYYMLTLMGMDVLLLQSSQDIGADLEALGLSEKFVLGEYGETKLPAFSLQPALFPGMSASSGNGRDLHSQGTAASGAGHGTEGSADGVVRVKLPERHRNKPTVSAGQGGAVSRESLVRPSSGRTAQSGGTVSRENLVRPSSGRTVQSGGTVSRESLVRPSSGQNGRPLGNGPRREMSFEELARLAASVVMITVHQPSGEPAGSGSGIMIGQGGYILTNHHVAAHGAFYTVSIEGENHTYRTEEIIKYNSLYDLAVIRIDRKLKPLPIFQGNPPLVRGQKVVAIGSPLGLFNSVSDGIISGFRTIRDVDMIQFTAPISHGSSGGAVLNMYGEVIGISTAGFDDGQNINLAMGYEVINMFIHGFTS